MLIAHPHVNERSIHKAQPRGVPGIGMDVAGGNDQPVGGEDSGRTLQRQRGRSIEIAAVTHRYVDAEREAVGA